MKKRLDSRWLLVGAMALFGTLAPFVRRISVSSGELALYRAVMAAALVGLFLLITGQKIPFAKIKREVPLLLFNCSPMEITSCTKVEGETSTGIGGDL